jgi:hypothetical protein
MGWAACDGPNGRLVGYSVRGQCEHHGCEAAINLGLGYACGGMHGENGIDDCSRYFCSEHLVFTEVGQRCLECARALQCSLAE